MDIALSLISLLIILFLIVLSCVLFTNAVEIAGDRLNLSEGAVGSILAAVGTALPETIVPLVAILGAYFTGSNLHESQEIGIGAILGAPFMLGTLAFFVTGIAVLIFKKAGKRSSDMSVNTVVMFRDIHYFAIAYFIAFISSFIHILFLKWIISAMLIVIYLVYVIKTVRACSKLECDCEEELEELFFGKYIKFFQLHQNMGLILQIIVSLFGIIVLAHFFIEQIKFLSTSFKINPFILSLILTPIATELPEKFNSVIWIRAKKDTLAIGNITGAMVFQSCILPAIGMVLTPWILNTAAIINILMVYLSVGVVYLNIIANKGILKPKALITGGIFYLIYLFYVLRTV